MTQRFLDAAGEVVPLAELTLPRAVDVARFVGRGKSPYASLVECRRHVGSHISETVVIDVEVERPQVRVFAIERIERVAITFLAPDDEAPEVLSLREDFPVVPHLNLRPIGHLPSFCLSELQWDAQKLRWTAAGFVEQLRNWLALTAIGRLHAADQSLEPLVAASLYYIVLPHDLFNPSSSLPDHLLVTRAGPADSACVLLARRPNQMMNERGTPYVAVTLTCKPQQHGVIRHAPTNLQELHQMLLDGSINLLTELRVRMSGWTATETRHAKLIVIVALPTTRGLDGAVEATDLRGFLCNATVAEIGKSIGVWGATQEGMGRLLETAQSNIGVGADVQVSVLMPLLSFSRVAGALLNGFPTAINLKIVAIGAGALGSQVTINLVRGGFGKWTLIDGDHLLPHNLARHGLTGLIGFPKADMLALEIATLLDRAEIPAAVVADVLRPGPKATVVATAISESDVVLDLSASVPVARHLARAHVTGGRRISAFMSPSGSDLVVLAEDIRRTIPLDCLEMQYYRALINVNDLSGHMNRHGDPIRYAQACRDVTSTIPQHLVAFHAATASYAIRRAIAKPEGSIGIWRTNPDTMAMRAITVQPAPVYTMVFGDWTLHTDEELLLKIADLRLKKLPNETGGILIGSYDLSRKIVYLVDTIPSPLDSKEWPTLYIRGSEDLPGKVEEIKAETGQNLEYAGEWHSHPKGWSCDPSADDHIVFAWLIRSMDVDGLPALMMIAGDGRAFQFFLGAMG